MKRKFKVVKTATYRSMQAALIIAIFSATLLAIDNFRLRGHVHQLFIEQTRTGLLLTRAKIKLDHIAELVSDLRNGRVD